LKVDLIDQTTLAFAIEHDALQETIGVVIVPVPGKPRLGLEQLQDLLRSVHLFQYHPRPDASAEIIYIRPSGRSPWFTWMIFLRTG
jgi:hypothetical protein